VNECRRPKDGRRKENIKNRLYVLVDEHKKTTNFR
jgi:hypothetical protein